MNDTQPPARLPTVREHTLVRDTEHLLPTVARQVARKFPRFVGERCLFSLGDLTSIGREAMYASAREFSEEFNHEFENFARARVRGAMLNALHELVYAERIDRAALLASDTYCAFHRDDTYNVLDHGYPEEATRRFRAFANGLLAATFAAAVEEAKRSGGEAELAERQEYELAIRALHAALARLVERDQKLLLVVYCDLNDLKAASLKLGISYSTVRRRHDKALGKLRDYLVAQGVARAPPLVGSPELGGMMDLGKPVPQNDQGPRPKR